MNSKWAGGLAYIPYSPDMDDPPVQRIYEEELAPEGRILPFRIPVMILCIGYAGIVGFLLGLITWSLSG